MSATDVHCHLDYPAFDADRSAVLGRAAAEGIDRVVVPGANPADWSRVLALVNREPACAAMLGIHPWYAADLTAGERERRLAELAGLRVAGIGEIGLDHLRDRDPARRERQIGLFRAQLALARARDLPVAIHAVHAIPQVLAVLSADGLPAAGGFVHGWSGSAELGREAVKLGLYLSFGPLVADPRARRARAAAAELPLERILLETDAPGRTERGEPADLVPLAAAVAALRGCPADRVFTRCAENADALLPRGAPAPHRAC